MDKDEVEATVDTTNDPIIKGVGSKHSLKITYVEEEGTYDYELINNKTEAIVIYGEGVPDKDSIYTYLSELNEALRDIFG